ncbi:ROK family protein [Microbacterium sp. MEC084]|uniref:ROK family transcriptional regulator n=1 Tax=Microbacterium sp. MEC084 TaxID=1963027 RepID=UPI001070361E|nr:ROK family transcriptional regulator [Microbacterium sp. MEC084]MCD1269351.1 ROK family protein [Microbacterium sp. MEC084]
MAVSTGRADVTRSAVLAHLGAQGPTSRADLARALSVSPALITQITRQLLDDALITELTHSPSQGGRPARLLGLAADAGHAIGVKVVSDHVTLVEVGIDGAVVRSATEPFDAAADGSLARLAEVLRAFIARGAGRTLLGVGVGVPGSVDDQAAGTVDSTQLDWQRAPLGEVLRDELGLPVLVENNVNALAMAEVLHGKARGHEDALVVTIGTGVGAGIIADGSVMRGRGGGAGELGHVPVEEGGPLCQCGAHGCLEALIARAALIDQARAAGVIPAGAGIDALRDAADRGDTAAQAIFSRAGHLLGRTLAGVVNLLDPELLILLGEGLDAWPHWSFGFEPAFRAGLMPRNRGILVSIETWQDDRWAQGAAALVLATPFDAHGRSGEQGRLVRERLAAADPGASS